MGNYRLALVAVALVTCACGSSAKAPTPPVLVGGSSTLAPLTQAIAVDFEKAHKGTKVDLSAAGTADGFTRFCRGDVDIVDASRPVTDAERAACLAAGVEFLELPVAYDALTVIVNVANTWAASMTVSELRKLWEPAAEGTVTKWSQIRSDWPDRPITLFGPGIESGTFDYFTDSVTGTMDASRRDYGASADDREIVRSVAVRRTPRRWAMSATATSTTTVQP